MSKPIICYNAKEVAAVTGLGLPTVRKLTRKGEIPHIKVGRRVLYPVSALHEWLFHQTFGQADSSTKAGEKNG